MQSHKLLLLQVNMFSVFQGKPQLWRNFPQTPHTVLAYTLKKYPSVSSYAEKVNEANISEC